MSLYRRRRGIPASREGGPTPTHPPLPGATGTGTQVYAVDIEEGGELVRWNLCAASFPDACVKLLGVRGRALAVSNPTRVPVHRGYIDMLISQKPQSPPWQVPILSEMFGVWSQRRL